MSISIDEDRCTNDCGRRAVGTYYLGNEPALLCSPCMSEQDERDEMEREFDA